MSGRSWRVYFNVEVEVSAENVDDAITDARTVVTTGNFDLEQMTVDDAVEVDPDTGMPIE